MATYLRGSGVRPRAGAGAYVKGDITITGNSKSAKFVASTSGTAAAPAFTFEGDEDGGLYRAAANAVVIAAGGAAKIYCDSNIQALNGNFSATGGFALTNDPDTTALASGGTTHNLSVSTAAATVRCNTAAGVHTITGITGGADGRYLTVHNIPTGANLTIAHENAGSTAANRFSLPSGASIVLAPGQSQEFKWDATISRWIQA